LEQLLAAPISMAGPTSVAASLRSWEEAKGSKTLRRGDAGTWRDCGLWGSNSDFKKWILLVLLVHGGLIDWSLARTHETLLDATLPNSVDINRPLEMLTRSYYHNTCAIATDQ
jgi:hypothetical protein